MLRFDRRRAAVRDMRLKADGLLLVGFRSVDDDGEVPAWAAFVPVGLDAGFVPAVLLAALVEEA